MSVSSEEIKKVVLAEDDFGHEMRVGNILSNAKPPENLYYPPADEIRVLPAEHGGTYQDRATGKTRQFDYRYRIIRGREISKSIFFATGTEK
ncbi:MAG TPA: hypothetical protein VMA35_06745 [Candidatus Sulfopaludibacter sp.]|nr:hypothetical protein [Candidatus Sulfopaludibacter sp.]